MAITNGPNLNSVPAAIQQTLSTNYLDLNGAGGWGQQYLPDLMEKEAEVFGPRTISGFLSQVGAEEAMTADQVVWSEQSRLHISYTGNMKNTNVFEVTKDIDGNAITTTHAVRLNDTVIIANANGVFKGVVQLISGADITIGTYNAGDIAQLTTANASTILVYGSEYGKGTGYYSNASGLTPTSVNNERHSANEPKFKTFTNKPIIMKDFYEVSGSDTSRIGWG